jgi:hypothetical protein
MIGQKPLSQAQPALHYGRNSLALMPVLDGLRQAKLAHVAPQTTFN